ncbi:Na+/H+ antiporter NhaC family protein [Clostridium sediminicola]|uniref:Na+/H+ antiporter NhaC family protein n=1 Tax=Clostridium sediminicola TaxID=3114879 RepID=UPI0031F21402
MKSQKPNFMALMPILIFLALTFSFGIALGSSKIVDALVFFMIATFVAIFMNRSRTTMEKVETFARGAANENTIIMIMIFLLAGAFAKVARDGGAVDSVVNLFLTYIPDFMLVPGLFFVACLVALALGTSVGTVTALAPVAVGLAETTGIPVALVVGAVLGGAAFGDNMSVISDTTIAATRLCGVEMRDKFRVNFLIVLPAGILTMIIFAFLTMGNNYSFSAGEFNLLQVLPFAVVLVSALMGMNVFYVLLSGIILAGGVGIYYNAFEHEFGQLVGLLTTAQQGMMGMAKISIIVLVVGGIIGIIKYNGGIDWIVEKLEAKANDAKSGMMSIIFLTILVTIFVANSTVAIVTAAPIAMVTTKKFGIDPRKTAAYLDMFGTATMANVPWGGMMLAAASTATASMQAGELVAVEIIKYSTYSHLVMISAIVCLFIGFPKLKPFKTKEINNNTI